MVNVNVECQCWMPMSIANGECQCRMLMSNANVECHRRTSMSNANVECQCWMPMLNVNLECQSWMSMFNANVQCQCSMPVSNANVERQCPCSCWKTMFGWTAVRVLFVFGFGLNGCSCSALVRLNGCSVQPPCSGWTFVHVRWTVFRTHPGKSHTQAYRTISTYMASATELSQAPF